MLPLLLSLSAPSLAEEPVAVVAAAPVVPVVMAAPTDEALTERLLGEPQIGTALPLGTPASSPWWMWPLGLLGAAGVAGLMYQNNRSSGGISSDVLILSRTAVSRNATLAVIEVADAHGNARRMLVGIGGGAPRLVADLSGELQAQPEPVAALEEDTAAVTGAELKETWSKATGRRKRSAPLQPPKNPALVDEEEDAPRRRGLAAYTSQGPDTPVAARKLNRGKSSKTELISEVLAARDEQPAKDDAWQDPWARNFAAILGQPSHQAK